MLGEGGGDGGGPVKAARCMSCDLECPLSVGILGDELERMKPSEDPIPCSRDSLVKEQNGMRCWLDAKGRDKLIVTPIRHVRSLAELSDKEAGNMFLVAVDLLQELRLADFQSLILNHGTWQNHAHLHLKVNINPRCASPGLPKSPGSNKRTAWGPSGDPKWWSDWMLNVGKKDLQQKLIKLQAFSECLPDNRRGLPLGWTNSCEMGPRKRHS
ncbi:unnamed protein product [Ostreobium quekettii]|uniref:HIT domain-containing protein n=1 Tax=Ostreobium quekettii TaxID=121088 RepID=A0A8S1ILB1_9CHLO|nr:unnamed protein product [Ostreobium quekettii]